MQETQVRSLGQEEPLEKELTTHSGILPWEIQWTEEPGGYSPCGCKRIGHDLETKQHQHTHTTQHTHTHTHTHTYFGHTTLHVGS